jgi:integration host factor subunit alpha
MSNLEEWNPFTKVSPCLFIGKKEQLAMALTKARIVESIHDQIGFTRNKSSEIVEILLELIKNTLASDEDVLISGFGKFCVKQKKERRGRNPATGEDLMLAPRKVVTFHCSGKLRNRINSG